MDGRLPAGVRGRVLLAAVVALSLATAGVVGYRLADPGAHPDHDLDLAESPDEIASDALSQLDHRDYAVEWRIPRAPDDQRTSTGEGRDSRVYLNATVEGSRNRVRTQSGDVAAFANDHCVWSVRSDERGTDGPSACDFERRQRPTEFYRLHGDWAAVREPDANVTVVRENESLLVLRVNDTDTTQYLATGRDDVSDTEYARERGLRANLTLVVDREAGHLRRLVFGRSTLSETDEESGGAGNRTREHSRHVYVFSKWGETTVERPDWAGYSLEEFLADVTR